MLFTQHVYDILSADINLCFFLLLELDDEILEKMYQVEIH